MNILKSPKKVITLRITFSVLAIARVILDGAAREGRVFLYVKSQCIN